VNARSFQPIDAIGEVGDKLSEFAHQPRSPYLTAREVIVYLRLGSRSALQRLLVEHALPFCRRGRNYLFDTREIDAWLHGHGSAIEMARAARLAIRKR
jgi:excisionase family DNA binding protein